jgi:hypothetical protein
MLGYGEGQLWGCGQPGRIAFEEPKYSLDVVFAEVVIKSSLISISTQQRD